MGDSVLDLYSITFWAWVCVAVAVVAPLGGPSVRRWAWSAINLAFLGSFLGLQVSWVIAAVAVAYFAIKAIGRGWLAPLPFVLAFATILALFLAHKLPDRASAVGLGRLMPVLSLVGFSYVALRLYDVARVVQDRRRPAPDFWGLINYLLPFHMLAAGPIQSYDEFASQPAVPPPLDAEGSLRAFERIAGGLFKKFVIANAVERLFLTGFRAGGPYVLFEMQWYYIWVYLDFSAYSDIAVGIGRLLGVATPENFNRPYLARNIIDFWDRWHISLSQFIRRNLFFPIQVALVRATEGGRPLLAGCVAFLVSFLLCGLWHGIETRWFLWGAFHASGLILCNVYKHLLTKRLGRKGVKAYLENRWIHALAWFVTFQFYGVSLLIIAYPLGRYR